MGRSTTRALLDACNPPLQSRSSWRAKLALERFVAVCALVVLSPVFAAIAILIMSDTDLPVFYRQVRVGRGRRPFVMYKFRTMVRDAERMEGGLDLSVDDDRITRVGRWLRTTSLDELPQLINVAKGEMSLIGPRPGLLDQVARYTPRQLRRLEVRPGLTGWAQVRGRNALSWDERIEHDIWYIDHWSPLLDLRIAARTPFVVFSRDGLYGVDGRNPDIGE
jgi:lipopolysaccharide/colanic/teichoic acid biosynthesis glycosyltransferase